MSVDHDSVSGVGIKITNKILNYLIQKNLYVKGNDVIECLENLDFNVKVAGSYWSGKIYFYVTIPGDTLNEVLENENAFLYNFKKIGMKISREDLIMISDILSY